MSLQAPYYLENYIDGILIAPLSSKFIECVNPATAEVFAQIPDSNKQDVELAVAAAKKAFTTWSKTTNEERCYIKHKRAHEGIPFKFELQHLYPEIKSMSKNPACAGIL